MSFQAVHAHAPALTANRLRPIPQSFFFLYFTFFRLVTHSHIIELTCAALICSAQLSSVQLSCRLSTQSESECSKHLAAESSLVFSFWLADLLVCARIFHSSRCVVNCCLRCGALMWRSSVLPMCAVLPVTHWRRVLDQFDEALQTLPSCSVSLRSTWLLSLSSTRYYSHSMLRCFVAAVAAQLTSLLLFYASPFIDNS